MYGSLKTGLQLRRDYKNSVYIIITIWVLIYRSVFVEQLFVLCIALLTESERSQATGSIYVRCQAHSTVPFLAAWNRYSIINNNVTIKTNIII